MKNKIIEDELKREVNSMLPDNMVAEVKQHDVKPEKVNKNIAVIHEKNRKSLIPMIASLVASLIMCLAVFLPVIIQSNEDYNNWLAQQKQEQLEEGNTEDSDITLEFFE